MKNKMLVLATLLGFAGCLPGNNPTSPDSNPAPAAQDGRRPGRIQLVSMHGMAKGSASLDAAASQAYTFDLDTARSSFQQYFILQNTGDFAVTNINLATDNPNFTFSPSHITVLPPSDSASLLQVIKLNVVHGKKLDELGYGNFLSPGLNTVNATITGSTVDTSSSVVPVSESATLKTYAKVATFQIIAQGTVYPLNSLLAGTTHNDLGTMPHYYVPIDTVANPYDTLSIKNTGNVPLTLRRWDPNTQASLSTLTLAVNASYKFTAIIVEIDANGVTFSPSTLPIGTDGKVLFILYGNRPH